jgi:superfamily II DNA or RNA helicase
MRLAIELPAEDSGPPTRVPIDAGGSPWTWLQHEILTVGSLANYHRQGKLLDGPTWQFRTGSAWVESWRTRGLVLPGSLGVRTRALRLEIAIDDLHRDATFEWWAEGDSDPVARGRVFCTVPHNLRWELTLLGLPLRANTDVGPDDIRPRVEQWLQHLPVTAKACRVERTFRAPDGSVRSQVCTSADHDLPFPAWLVHALVRMATPPARSAAPRGPVLGGFAEDTLPPSVRRFQEEMATQREAEERIRLRADQIRRREAERRAQRKAAAAAEPKPQPVAAQRDAAPLPTPPLHVEPMQFPGLPGVLPRLDLSTWFLRERALQSWVSNQTDDLLALPFCRIDHLEYQLRTALRVIGPLRGRALLSDEVGLGKTIEAGLILREYVTRGMVKRFLVVTLPSLVDQWAEELESKFGLDTATTNDAARSSPDRFWSEPRGIVASLHTLKQPAHLALARAIPWDLLIVDEAHHLRNRESQAWQAVNVLPRQFLLLLTATPVQNSLDELYNLITLLQPGHLPSPKEFRSRFIDPKRPRQPREPEELRRLLGQVMIRNTRANAGVNLPPRRAHTVFFETSPEERAFSTGWETEFRTELTRLPPAQASLWGRLVLQAAGSSPAAWHDALERFPNHAVAQRWRNHGGMRLSWEAKCSLLPPLAQTEGGVVVFTQFLATQAALHQHLLRAGVPVILINGQTPAAERQPLTDEFRQRGGVLLLSRSGTEGRNLQFCARLVNFDLPWNPMEIEQRIGRLHRLGQTRPVHIHNLVAQDTLQHHLLDLLQEKLNLFELVVGETGLILGERYASDEFAEEILHRWRTADGDVRAALGQLGDELVAARDAYGETRKLDASLFARDYESD